MSEYSMIVLKDEDSSFGVYFPDLPGCYAAGDTHSEAVENGRISLRLYAEELTKDGKSLPAPRSLEELMADEDVRLDLCSGHGFMMVVPLLYVEIKRRVNVTLEPSLIAALDRTAEIAGTSRSDILAIAARRYLEAETGAVQVSVPEPKATSANKHKAAA